MLRNTDNDIETIFKISRELERTSQQNKEYRAKLFREIFEEHEVIKAESDNEKVSELRRLSPKEILGKLIELCMEADYLRRLPPNLIQDLHKTIEDIDLLTKHSDDKNSLQGSIDALMNRFREIVRYVANVAYAKPNPPALDLNTLAALSQKNKREIIG
jgi:actin-related protein